MLYDFHIHTREFSYCAESTAEEICLAAIGNDLHGIALTDHDHWWPDDKVSKLRQRYSNLLILRGVEYTCHAEHFLIFLPEGADEKISPALRVHELIPLVRSRGGVVIWSHPFRWDRRMPLWLADIRPDGMEVASNNMDAIAQNLARKVAAARQIMMFQNSDAHHWQWLGKYANALPRSLHGVDDFIGYVTRGG